MNKPIWSHHGRASRVALLSALLLATPALAVNSKPAAKAKAQNQKDIVLATDAPPAPATSALVPAGELAKTAPSAAVLLPEVSSFGGALGELGLHLLRSDGAANVSSNDVSNRVVSPYGVAAVLGMLHSGASGATASEIAGVLEPSVSQGRKLGERMKAITQKLAEPNAGVDLAVAQRIWLDESLVKSISPAYAQIIRSNYHADGALVRFSNNTEASATINQWVEKATHGKIKELLAPASVPPTTRAIVTSALYLKAAWSEPFNPAATRDLPFFTRPGKSVAVPTMSGLMRVKQGVHNGLKIVELPYARGDIAFYVALPVNPAHTLNGLQQDVSGLDIAAWPRQVVPLKADVYLPRFRIDPQPLALKEALQQVNVHTAFTEAAHFEGIAGKSNLVIDNVFHGAGIVVNEQGSEASAATAAVAGVKSLSLEPQPEIRIDRPFLFVVMHIPTTTPLFVGRVAMPKP